MREKSHPRRKLICEARQDGHSQTQHLKEVPRPGDENAKIAPFAKSGETLRFKRSPQTRGRKLPSLNTHFT